MEHPIKFKDNVTSKITKTASLERQLLHALMSDKLNLQRTVGKHRSDFFVTPSRLFIYDCISRTFNEKRTILQYEQFEFELEKRFDPVKDKTRIEDYKTEFEIIKKTPVNESLDVILQNLEEVQLANSTEKLIREAYSELENGNYSEAAQLLKRNSINLGSMQKENRIYNLHKDNADWFEEVQRRHDHPEIYAGIPTGFKRFDQETGGLFPAELTVVFGLSGKGKSTLMKGMACNIRKAGYNVLHCGNEENEFQMRSKYMSADSGALYSVFKKGTYTDEQFMALKKYSDGEKDAKGNIFIYEFPQQTDASWIERAYRQLETQGIKIDVIIVDYLDLMKPCEKAYSENDEGGKITSDLKQVAINCNVPLITATQAGIQAEKQERKERPFLNQSDVFGTKRKVHSANTLIGIVNTTATTSAQEGEKTPEMHHLVLCVPKQRDGRIFVFRMKMHAPTGVFYEEDGDSANEAALQSIAEQSLKMCDETLPPGQMQTEISMEEVNKAKLKDLQRQVAELEKEQTELAKKKEESETQNELANDDNATTEEYDDSFFTNAPSEIVEEKTEEEPPHKEIGDDFLAGDDKDTTTSESDDDDLDEPDEPEDFDEPDEPDETDEVEEVEEEPEETEEAELDEEDKLIPFSGEHEEKEPEKQEQPEQKQPEEEQKQTEEEQERSSDSINHKKSLSELFGKKRN